MVLVPLEFSVINALICNISSGKWEITPRIFFRPSSLVAYLVKNITLRWGLSMYLKTKKITFVSSQMIEQSPLRDVLGVSVAETVTCWPRRSSPGSWEQTQKLMD